MGTRPSRLETNHFYPTRKTRFECQISLNYGIGLVNCACEEKLDGTGQRYKCVICNYHFPNPSSCTFLLFFKFQFLWS